MAVVMDPYGKAMELGARSGEKSKEIMEIIQGFIEKGNQSRDMSFLQDQTAQGGLNLSQMSPDQALALAPQMKSNQFKTSLMNYALKGAGQSQQQPVYGYDSEGKYGQIGTQPQNAVTVQPDPDKKLLLQSALNEQRDQARFAQQDKMQTDRDAQQGKMQAEREAAAEARQQAMFAQQQDLFNQKQEALAKQGITQFKDFPEDDQEQAFRSKLMSGENPKFAFGDKASCTQFNAGYNAWKTKNSLDAADEVTIRGKVKGDTKTLANNENRLAATEQFQNTIMANSAQIKAMKAQYGQNFGKLLNAAVNATKQGTMGSGDVGALQFAMRSLGNEAAKVESGSLGNAEVSVEQAKAMHDILSYNYNEKDLDKVLDTVNTFGGIRKKAIEDESDTIEERMRNPAAYKKLMDKKQAGKPQDMQSGAQQVVNGITYVQGADGQWHKQE